ncbi:GNAT family N-acetyltransferase [Paenibacillus turpanensis]|uniref:GNAT family N-acetyltransferase n=1 Tax=Paenibacillus turpanensis TaxID=2689078 RepID=UPI00140911DE|nr:GNAT family N-acetyltransferase [Paenibacillus turpanensis]
MGEIRNLRYEELDDLYRLHQFSFQYVLSKEDLAARRANAKTEWLWGNFEGNTLTSAAVTIPLQVFIRGQAHRMSGVAGVATWPEYRRTGKVEALLVHCLKMMKERGEAVSMLAPFSFPFYRKFGWEMMTELKHYTISGEQLSPVLRWKCAGSYERVDAAKEWPLLNRMYGEFARRYNGMLVRDEHWWKTSVLRRKTGHTVVYRSEAGTPAGYLIYSVEKKTMSVKELVWLDEEARTALWRFIANHDSMVNEVKATVPASDRLPFLLSDPRIKQEIEPYFMFRVVDVESFAGQLAFASNYEGKLGLTIEDPYAPWNVGSYVWQVKDGRAILLERGAADDQRIRASHAEAAWLECGIQEFSAIALGAEKPALLHQTGRLGASDEAVKAWSEALPAEETFLLDFF